MALSYPSCRQGVRYATKIVFLCNTRIPKAIRSANESYHDDLHRRFAAVPANTFFTKTAGAVLIRGAGTRGCGEWVAARRGGTASSAGAVNMEGWILGYLSGNADALNIDILRNVSAESIFLWMDNYCKANPLERLWKV